MSPDLCSNIGTGRVIDPSCLASAVQAGCVGVMKNLVSPESKSC